MTDDAKTDEMTGLALPAPERAAAVLFDAAPGRPGELVLRVFVGDRLVELALDLSAGDRVLLAAAVAAVAERPSRAVAHSETVRRPPGGRG